MRRSLLLLSLWPWAVQADTLDHSGRHSVGTGGCSSGNRFAPMPPPLKHRPNRPQLRHEVC